MSECECSTPLRPCSQRACSQPARLSVPHLCAGGGGWQGDCVLVGLPRSLLLLLHSAAVPPAGHFGRSDLPEVFTWEKVLPLKDA